MQTDRSNRLRSLSLYVLGAAALFPFAIPLGACGGGGTPANVPGNASASTAATAAESATTAMTASGQPTSSGPASAAPTASQPSEYTSKKTTRKQNAEWLTCHKTYQPQGKDLNADVAREAGLCQDETGMHQVGETHKFHAKDEDAPNKFTFAAKSGKCYRAFAESGHGIQDLDLAMKDGDGNLAGEDSTDDPNPIVLEDGAVCWTTDDPNAVVSATIGDGEGDYVVSLWSDE